MSTAPLHQRLAQRLDPRVHPDLLPALGVFAAALAIYLPTLSPGVVPGDGGELQTLTGTLGISHPTGYPLLLLLSRAFSTLPVPGDLAYRVTLLGALLTAGAAVAMYFALRELRARPVAAASGALLMAAAPRLWMHAAAAEVYPLSEFFLALSLYLLIRWGNGRAPLWAPALALGFGLSHHVSIRLFGPAVLAYLLVVEPRLPLAPRRWLPALAALLLPLLAYSYFPLRFQHFQALEAYRGEILGIPKLIAAGFVSPHYYANGALGLFLAQTYSGGFLRGGLSIGEPAVRDFLGMLRLQFPLIAAPVMLAGIVALVRRQWRVAVLVLVGGLTTLLIALRFLTIYGEDGDHFIPVYMLLALCYGFGAEALLGWAERRLPRQKWVGVALAVALIAVPLASAVVRLPAMRAGRAVAQPALLTPDLPAGAVIAGDWRDVTPLWYRQQIQNVRPDVWVVQADAAGVALLAQRALAEGTPFYEILPGATGPRLLPIPLRDTSAIPTPAPPDQQQMSDAIRWLGYGIEPAIARAGEALDITLYWQALAPVAGEWTTFIHLVGEDNLPLAQVDRQPLTPELPLSQWQPGLRVADPYTLRIPETVAPGRYRLLFGWYKDGQRLVWANGQDTQQLAKIEVVAP